MTTRVESAVERFSEGYNCAQAMFSTYAPLFGIKEQDALRISTAFGGGMGRLQEVCGAVTGALMLFGCKHGMVKLTDTDEKEKAYELVQAFTCRFRELHGSILCKELLWCDINTPEGRQHYAENNLSKTVCTQCVRDAAMIVEETLLKK